MSRLNSLILAVVFLTCNVARAGVTLDFEQGALCYQILSEEAQTVAVCGTNDSDITFVEIPPTVFNQDTEYMVIAITDLAFYGCSKLEKVEMPETMTRIGNSAFKLCAKLKNVQLPESVAYVGLEAFANTDIDSITVHGNVQYGDYAYTGIKGIKNVAIEYGVKRIPNGMFAGHMEAGLPRYVVGCENIVFPQTIESIGSCAFLLNQLRTVDIPESCTEIDSAAFSSCPLVESITLPASLKKLDKYAFFSNVSLREVSIPASVTTLQTGVFAECRNLEKIAIHSENIEHFFTVDEALTKYFSNGINMTHVMEQEPLLTTVIFGKEVKRIAIGNNKERDNGMPFGNHARIQNVYCEGTTPPEGGIWQNGATLHVPKGCREAYASANIWKLYGDNIVDDINLEGIRSIKNEELKKNNAIYDLQGRSVTHPKQGEIYIQQGKKVRK